MSTPHVTQGVMNARRQGLVAMAFRVLDTDGSGIVDLDDIRLVSILSFTS